MKRLEYPAPLQELVRQLKRLPGIGPRSAERIALWMIATRDARPGDLATAITTTCQEVRPCSECGFFSLSERCVLCSDPARSGALLCVVEQPTDILPIERTGLFAGKYHALGGRIAPLDHVGPDDLRIGPLLARVHHAPPEEIILALSADVEGEATSNYLAELLKPSGARITRLAQGLPAGTGLDSADELTLGRALSGRLRF